MRTQRLLLAVTVTVAVVLLVAMAVAVVMGVGGQRFEERTKGLKKTNEKDVDRQGEVGGDGHGAGRTQEHLTGVRVEGYG